MKILFQFLLLLALNASSCVFATNDSAIDNFDNDQDRQLRITPKMKKIHKIKALGTPKTIRDSKGKIKRRKSIVDLSELTLGDGEAIVDIQLMSDEAPQTLKMKRGARKAGSYESWYGMDSVTGNHLTMVKTITTSGETVTTGTMFGNNGTVYQIRSLADGNVVAEEVKPGMFDKELDALTLDALTPDATGNGDGNANDGIPGGGRRHLRRLLDSPNELDIMVLYTKGAMCSAAGLGSGGTCADTPANRAKIEGVIALAVVETNQAYELSGIPTKLRLVKTHFEPTYNDYTNTFDTTLGKLQSTTDGQLDYVHSMRDQYGADFVSMFVDTGSYCGIGYLPSTPRAAEAFSLVQWSCATGYYSFAHELGHNMGCNHDVQSAGGTGVGSNYGYRDPSARFRSILAYDCSPSCTRVQQFSSSTVKYNGISIGSATADNAAQITRNLQAFANFRQSTIASTQQPTRSPTPVPTQSPTRSPTPVPTQSPTFAPTQLPTRSPTLVPTQSPTFAPTQLPTRSPTPAPTQQPTASPSIAPTQQPTQSPTVASTQLPTVEPSTPSPTADPTQSPTPVPTQQPTASPTPVPTQQSTLSPTTASTQQPTQSPTTASTQQPTQSPTTAPTPTKQPTKSPTPAPTQLPTVEPSTPSPTGAPTQQPTASPTPISTQQPTNAPFTKSPTTSPTPAPSVLVALPTPVPSPGSQFLSTSFASNDMGAAGNMFDIRATKSLTVTNFAVHASAASTDVTVEIYKKITTGKFLGTQFTSTKWVQIGKATFKTNAAGGPSILPEGTITPVFVKAGTVQAFYITFTEDTNYNRYSIGSTYGATQVSNADLVIRHGYAKHYRFGGDVPERAWNGVLYYKTAASTTRSIPTSPPASKPSSKPTFRADKRQTSTNGGGQKKASNGGSWMDSFELLMP